MSDPQRRAVPLSNTLQRWGLSALQHPLGGRSEYHRVQSLLEKAQIDKGYLVHKVTYMRAAKELGIPYQKQGDTHTDRLLRIADSAKDAKANGGANLSHMTREERREILFRPKDAE